MSLDNYSLQNKALFNFNRFHIPVKSFMLKNFTNAP